jgi:hypothetical protein
VEHGSSPVATHLSREMDLREIHGDRWQQKTAECVSQPSGRPSVGLGSLWTTQQLGEDGFDQEMDCYADHVEMTELSTLTLSVHRSRRSMTLVSRTSIDE